MPPAAVLALLINERRHAKKLRHLLLIVNEIAPFQPRLKDHLQTVTRGRNKRHQDTYLLQIEMRNHLLPILLCRLTVERLHHVVEIHHAETVQTYTRLLAPARYNLFLILQFIIVRDEDHQRQRRLLTVTIRLHLLLTGHLIHRLFLIRFQPFIPLLIPLRL